MQDASLSILRESRLAQFALVGVVCGALIASVTRNTYSITVTTYVAIIFGLFRAALFNRGAFKQVFFGKLQLKEVLVVGAISGLSVPILTVAFGLLASSVLHLARTGSPVPDRPTLAFVAFAVVLGPIAETAIFQLWLQTPLMSRAAVSLLVTSVAFIAYHFRLDAALIIISFALAMIRQRTESVGAVWIAHLSYNCALLALIFWF